MLVALSWTMFCLDQEHTGDRIAIGVTLFLTMIFLHGYANSSLPKVSYVKMVDLFMVVSLGEILLITIETIIIARLYQWDRNAKDKDENHCERVCFKLFQPLSIKIARPFKKGLISLNRACF